jgi:hypothetical protein
MPWTLVVIEQDEEGWTADLEHGAPLPRIGERLVYIAEDGTQHHFRVHDVTHTVQASASERPPVRASAGSPNATVSGAHPPHAPHGLRAGLPRVFVRAED